MNARTIRRAQERKALKAARKQAVQQQEQPELSPEQQHQEQKHHDYQRDPAQPPAHAPSEALDWVPACELQAKRAVFSQAKLRANRANSRLSTGPTSETGKTASSKNALKTGLTGRTVLLPSDDVAKYETHVNRFFTNFQPATEREAELVLSMAETRWRLNRIPALELGIYALARLKFAGDFEGHDPEEADALIQAQAYITYNKQLSNLSIQEIRLRRQYKSDLHELAKLTGERESRERRQRAAAAVEPPPAPTKHAPAFSPASPSTMVASNFQHPTAVVRDPSNVHLQPFSDSRRCENEKVLAV